MCDQQRRISASAYVQSDQSLFKSHEYFMSVKLLPEHRLEFLSLNGGCTGSFESIHVKMTHCLKSHVASHIAILVAVKHKGRFIRCRHLSPQQAAKAQTSLPRHSLLELEHTKKWRT